jgi:cyclopropane fatty-acyl-phospholipid synthase-like methyltransferase
LFWYIQALKPRYPYLQRLIRQVFPRDRNSAILDLGFSWGGSIHLARQEGYQNIRGVNRSAEQVAAAINLYVDGFERNDAMEPLAKEKIAAIDCLVTFD